MGIFTGINTNFVRRSNFNLTHDKKLTMNMGRLVPVFCMEAVPSDTVRLQSHHMVRLPPLVSPMMQRVNVYTHYFAVPKRLLWKNWQTFMANDTNTVLPVHPYYTCDQGIEKGSVADYLGYPVHAITDVTDPIKVDPSYLAAYNFIYNEIYRDQNLIAELDIPLLDGENNTNPDLNFVVGSDSTRRRAWAKDRFTSALPEPQLGAEVMLPLGDTADINFKAGSLARIKDITGAAIVNQDLESGAGGVLQGLPSGTQGTVDNADSLEVDLSTASSASINDFRLALALQGWFEKQMRGGRRYIEMIKTHFNWNSSDARLQRPEYLGGGMQPMNISEVLQTSQSNDTPQGNMAGHGIGVGSTNSFTYTAEEHCIIIGIMSIMPEASYYQGLHPMFTRFQPLDYLYPSFANLGEQPIKNQELFLAPTQAERDETFGYQSMYSDYKFLPSTIHGDMRDTLDTWHMGRKFASQPQLNDEFIECEPQYRPFAVLTNTDHCWVQVVNEVVAKRPLPFFSNPSLL